MPTAYIQLGANWSSPSICIARATGWGGIIVEVLLTRGKASTCIPISERQSFYCFRWEVSQRLRWGGAPPL